MQDDCGLSIGDCNAGPARARVSLFFFLLRTCGVFLLTLFVGPLLFSQSYDALSLAEKNEGLWQSIHKIDMCYTRKTVVVFANEKKQTERRNTEDCFRWISGGDCEQLIELKKPSESEEDYSNRKSRRYIRCDDRAFEWSVKPGNASFKPATLEESLDHECRATQLVNGESHRRRLPKESFLMGEFRSPKEPNKPVNLIRFLESCERLSIPVRSVDANGDILWAFRIDSPENDQNPESAYSELTFNESKSFCLHRFFSFRPAAISGATMEATGEKVSIINEYVVWEYIQLSNGYYLPRKTGSGVGPPSFRGHPEFFRTQYEITSVSINEQVTTDPCFVIPEFFMVLRDDLTPRPLQRGQTVAMPVSFWGKDNQPAITLQTPQEVEKYLQEARDKKQTALALTPRPISWTRIVLAVAGLVLILLALFLKARNPNKS